MCTKCIEVDAKIAHYKRMAILVTDQKALDGIASMIKSMTADKAANRCESQVK